MNVPVHFRNSHSIVPFDIHTVVRVLLKIHNLERTVVLFLLVPLALQLYICYESITVTQTDYASAFHYCPVTISFGKTVEKSTVLIRRTFSIWCRSEPHRKLAFERGYSLLLH